MTLALVSIAALAVGAWFLTSLLLDTADIVRVLRRVDPRWFVACFAFEITSYLAYAHALDEFTRQGSGPRIGARGAGRLMLASLGGTRIAPFAGAGGLAVMIWAFRQMGLDSRDAFARVLGLNILVFAVFGLIGWFAALSALLIPAAGRGVPGAMSATWAIGIPACIAAACWLNRRSARAGVRQRSRAAQSILDGIEAVGHIARRARRHLRLILSCAIYWLADIGCLMLALTSVDGRVRVVPVCLAYATGYVAMMAPLPTGGFGAVEAAVTASLVGVGTPVADALAAVAIWRAFNFWLPTAPALVALVRLPGLGREFREQHANSCPDSLTRGRF